MPPQGSLVPETLKEMETDVDFQRTKQALLDRGQAALTAEERKQRRRALDKLGVPSFDHFLKEKVCPTSYVLSVLVWSKFGAHKDLVSAFRSTF